MSEQEREFYYPDPTVRIRVRVVSIVVALLVIVATIFSPRVRAADINLTWSQPDLSTCVDGSPAATNCPLTGVEIQYLEDASKDAWTIKQGVAPTTTKLKLTGYGPGHYCFRYRNVSKPATAINPSYSDPSEASCIDIPFVSPRAPIAGPATYDVVIKLEQQPPAK